jgi:hypothetical protein
MSFRTTSQTSNIQKKKKFFIDMIKYMFIVKTWSGIILFSPILNMNSLPHYMYLWYVFHNLLICRFLVSINENLTARFCLTCPSPKIYIKNLHYSKNSVMKLWVSNVYVYSSNKNSQVIIILLNFPAIWAA